jgi:1,4-dihydroxy-2-naphthoate octaprenyltransferase
MGVAYGWLIAAVTAGWLPWAALIALGAAVPAARAARELLAHAREPARLVSALKATIGAAMMHGVLLATGLSAARLV